VAGRGGWAGFHNTHALKLAFRACDTAAKGEVRRSYGQLEWLLRYIVYFHVMHEPLRCAHSTGSGRQRRERSPAFTFGSKACVSARRD
jgi:hypothetical protein